MLDLSDAVLTAFRDELRKEAGLADTLKNVGSLGGVGAMLGAGGGAVLGGVRGYQQAQEQGQSGLSGVAGGALRGGVLGGAAGGLAGGVAGGLAKKDYGQLLEHPVLGAGARFGQRQVHGVTGMLTPDEIGKVRGGATSARKALDAARPAGSSSVPRLEKAHAAASDAQRMGLTSIPGYVKSLAKHPIDTLRTSAKEQIHSAPLMTAATVGMPVAAGVLAPHREDEGLGERAGRITGGVAGSLAGGVMPLGGQLAASAGAERIGAWAGRGADRLRGRRPHNGPTPTLEPAEAQHMPTERVMSPAAMGQPPESLA